MPTSVLLEKSYAFEAAKIPLFKRYYVIRKIKDGTCVNEINQNQILSSARTCIILENQVSFNDTISYWDIKKTAFYLVFLKKRKAL